MLATLIAYKEFPSFKNFIPLAFFFFCRVIRLKDVHSGEVTVLYDAKKAISKLNTPVLVAPQVWMPWPLVQSKTRVFKNWPPN